MRRGFARRAFASAIELVAGGRLVANVPGPAPRLFRLMADGLAHHLGPDSASFVHAVFSLHDPRELHSLATQAGFYDVDVRSSQIALNLPSPAEFLWQYVWSTPLPMVVAQVGEARASPDSGVVARAVHPAPLGPQALNVCSAGETRGRGEIAGETAVRPVPRRCRSA
jgi:hypothetical protein